MHKDRNICVYVLCIEKYDYDLISLYNCNHENFSNNISIIEEKLLIIFTELATKKHIFADLKPENIVVKLNERCEVIDLKIIDIDPLYCLEFTKLFNSEKIIELELSESNLFEHIGNIYKHILNGRTNNLLFSETTNMYKVYIDIICKLIILNKTNMHAIRNLDNLISDRKLGKPSVESVQKI
jgi:hypothetical protein